MSTASRRLSPLPPGWAHIRAHVLRRDGHRCTYTRMLNGKTYRCRVTKQLEVDHISGRDDHTLANLATLCRHHHQIKTSKEARAAQLSRGRRPAVVHHGLRNIKKQSEFGL